MGVAFGVVSAGGTAEFQPGHTIAAKIITYITLLFRNNCPDYAVIIFPVM